MRKKNMKLVYLIIGLGALLQGYLTGVIAGVLPFMIKEFDLNTTIQGLVSSFIFFWWNYWCFKWSKLFKSYWKKESLYFLCCNCCSWSFRCFK